MRQLVCRDIPVTLKPQVAHKMRSDRWPTLGLGAYKMRATENQEWEILKKGKLKMGNQKIENPKNGKSKWENQKGKIKNRKSHVSGVFAWLYVHKA